jgi:hypothetical protein
VDQNENQDLISAANFARIPNPGSVSRRAGREIVDVSPRVGAVGGHFATVSFVGGPSAALAPIPPDGPPTTLPERAGTTYIHKQTHAPHGSENLHSEPNPEGPRRPPRPGPPGGPSAAATPAPWTDPPRPSLSQPGLRAYVKLRPRGGTNLNLIWRGPGRSVGGPSGGAGARAPRGPPKNMSFCKNLANFRSVTLGCF